MRRGYGRSGGTPNGFMSTDAFGLEDAKEIQATIDFMSQQPYVDEKQMVLVGQSGGGLASLAYGSLGKANPKGIINFAGGLKKSRMPRWPFMMAEAFASYAKTTRVPSVWFYAANDSFFLPDVARMAYEAYQKEHGQAKLFALPAFKKDGHYLFSDPSGIEIWRGEALSFTADWFCGKRKLNHVRGCPRQRTGSREAVVQSVIAMNRRKGRLVRTLRYLLSYRLLSNAKFRKRASTKPPCWGLTRRTRRRTGPICMRRRAVAASGRL